METLHLPSAHPDHGVAGSTAAFGCARTSPADCATAPQGTLNFQGAHQNSDDPASGRRIPAEDHATPAAGVVLTIPHDPSAEFADIEEIALPGDNTPLCGAHPKTPDPDQQINEAVLQHQLGLADWKMGEEDLTLRLRQTLDWYQSFRASNLLPTDWKGVPLVLPEHVRITFEPRPVRELGFYVPGRAVGDGALYRININPRAILHHRRSAAQTASVMLHEALHLCEDLYRRTIGKPSKGGSYHSVEFRRRLEETGIPCTQNGAELGVTPGSPFDQWLERYRIRRVYEEVSVQQVTSKMLPKRVLWKCGCADAVKVMVPRASSIRFVCQVCSCPVRPVTR